MLTDVKARKIRAGGKPIHVGGVPGLYFRPTTKNGAGKFILRFVSPETRKRRDMGLGIYPAVGIAEARQKAVSAHELIENKIDPIEEQKRVSSSNDLAGEIPTFEEVALNVHATISIGFNNTKHAQQWINTLQVYAFPNIGNIPVDKLTPSNFADFLRETWITKPETASRVRQRCERVMMWCVAEGLVVNNPVASVSALLPKQKSKRDRVQHFPSIPWRQLPQIVNRAFNGESQSMGKQALLYLTLTAARSGEVRGATWEEIDFDNRVWAIPAERMKAGAMHRVPLSDQSIGILENRIRFSQNSKWVFSNTGKSMLSDMTLTKVLRDNNVESDTPGRVATAHGIRSTFRDWASETGYSRDLAERALAHTISNQTEAAYHRTDLLEQRRGMMQSWGEFILSLHSQH